MLPETKTFEISYLIQNTNIVGYVPKLGSETGFCATFYDFVVLQIIISR
jgi:hypothetical protein